VPGDPPQATGPGDPLFDYTERFSAVLVAAGFPPMPARVFVALLVADSGRLSAAELAAMLRISPAAVSGAVRYLIQIGLAHKERVPGSRRDYYRMPGGMWDSLIRQRDQVMTRWTARASTWSARIPRPASGWPSRPTSSSSPPRNCPACWSAGSGTAWTGRAPGED
jgi:predicted transcriptional regulator